MAEVVSVLAECYSRRGRLDLARGSAHRGLEMAETSTVWAKLLTTLARVSLEEG
jgi:hypothetical protein